jgi:hypothetical protein
MQELLPRLRASSIQLNNVPLQAALLLLGFLPPHGLHGNPYLRLIRIHSHAGETVKVSILCKEIIHVGQSKACPSITN